MRTLQKRQRPLNSVKPIRGMLSKIGISFLQLRQRDFPWIPSRSGIRATRTEAKEPIASPSAIHDPIRLDGEIIIISSPIGSA